ncbi:MAG: NUDIX domain-containing protein [Candidatus Peribacteria bacterium]|nr:MAG: NUDIX domain-containing protein [Candidatus Peribacteria bacterium]
MPITDGVKIFIKNKQLNQFVLMLRDDKPTIPLPNMWCLFGGGIDEDETPLAAVERELTEEIDIPVYAIRHIHTMPIQHQVQ